MTRGLAVSLSAMAMLVTMACAETDPGITTAVKSRLAADDTVKAYQIDVDTTDSVVTLTGTVDTTAARTQAVALARQTDGVRNVVDQITVGPEPTATSGVGVGDRVGEAGDRVGDAADRATGVATDAAITSAVKTKFLADTTVSGLKIDIDTKDGVATLSGNVASQVEADRAVSLARETNGVKEVINNLRVTKG